MPRRYKHSWCFSGSHDQRAAHCLRVGCLLSLALCVFSVGDPGWRSGTLQGRVAWRVAWFLVVENRIAWDEELNPTSVFKAAAQTRWPSHSIGRRESRGKGHSYRTHGKKGSEWLWTAPQRADYVIRIFLFWTPVLLIICWVCSGMVLNLRSQFQYLGKKKTE